MLKRFLKIACAMMLCLFMLPVTVHADGQATVTLTVDSVADETAYTTIQDAVNALKSRGTYGSAVITLNEVNGEGAFTENVNASGLNNLTFNSTGTVTLKGTMSVNGTNVGILGIHFESVLTNPVGYYDDDTAINMSGGKNISVVNCSFNGYNYVSNYYGDTAGIIFQQNTVTNCAFFLHTSDGAAQDLQLIRNTITGSSNLICASLLGGSNVLVMEGNTFTNANFGLQNCSQSMAGFVGSNTFNNGYLIDDTVNYGDGQNPHTGSTIIYTTAAMPDGASSIVIKSDDADQQAAIDAGSVSIANGILTMSFSGQGVAAGYHYNSISIDYEYYGKVTVVKEVSGSPSDADLNSLTFTITDADGKTQEKTFSQIKSGDNTFTLTPGTYTVSETGSGDYTVSVNGEAASSIQVVVAGEDTQTVTFTNTYSTTTEEEKKDEETPKEDTSKTDTTNTSAAMLPEVYMGLIAASVSGAGVLAVLRRKSKK